MILFFPRWIYYTKFLFRITFAMLPMNSIKIDWKFLSKRNTALELSSLIPFEILEGSLLFPSRTGIFSSISNERSISSKPYTHLQNCYFSKPALDSKTRIGERSSVEKLFRVRDREVGRFHQKLLDGRCKRGKEREKKSGGKKNKREKGVTNERGEGSILKSRKFWWNRG